MKVTQRNQSLWSLRKGKVNKYFWKQNPLYAFREKKKNFYRKFQADKACRNAQNLADAYNLTGIFIRERHLYS